VEVAGVIRPNRQARRRRGKSGGADAVAAALAALNGEASGTPKSGDGAVEAGPGAAGRPPRRHQGPYPGRQPATRPDRHRPGPLRDKLAGLPTRDRVKVAARFRPGDLTSPAEAAKAAMAAVARRHQA